jgi:uncharacterized protein YbbC (DUF1343 family)
MRRIFVVIFFLVAGAGQLISQPAIIHGDTQFHLYLPQLKDKRVGVMVNNTSMLGYIHLVDLLKSLNVNVTRIYSVEHGFRGNVPDGEQIKDEVDPSTGVKIISLYGTNYKATPAQMADVDVVLFDIQDVGTRFFTYISSMTYLMESSAESNKKLIVLDRPNPNGFVDGPIMQAENKSFVGMHPIPIAHGMTIGEMALMINGEGWLAGQKKCDLEVVRMINYNHDMQVHLPQRPSPNLPNDNAIAWYPSTCLFEGTALSIGRGTQNPFEFIGHPDLKNMPFKFTPVSIEGMSTKPKLENQLCYGIDLRDVKPERKVSLKYLIEMYQAFPDKEKFFIPYIDKLAGTKEFKEQIKQGMTEEQIRESWKKGLDDYKVMRKKYLLYP